MFVGKLHKKENLSLLNDMFTLLNTNHDYTARAGSKNLLDTPSSQFTHYGKKSVRAKTTSNWNLPQRIINVDLPHEFKKTSSVSIMETSNNLHNNN